MSEDNKKYQLPGKLHRGDKIAVVAPASAAEKEATEKGINYLKNRGYEVEVAPNLTKKLNYLAGNDEERLKNLHRFLVQDDISALFCVRGGYGMTRIIDKLKYKSLSNIKSKIIMGYSDITILQFAFLRQLGWITFSGPMVASEMGSNFTAYSEKWMWKVLEQSSESLELQNPANRKMHVYRSGTATGILLPGCLSLINCLLGTEYCPSFENGILVLEDIGETGYKLDRLLTTLKLHGVFNQISGLILGSFKSTDDNSDQDSFTMKKLLDDIIGDYDFPVITNFAYGHIKKRLTLPVGIKAGMSTDPLEIKINFSGSPKLV